MLLGWVASVVLQPFGDPAFRMNLLAGLCVAAAAGITVDLVGALTRSTLAGILAGLGLAFTPIVWAIGTRADVHALHLLFVAAILRLLVAWRARVDAGPPARPDRWLVAAAVVFGLSVGNHSLTLLLAPPIAVFVWLVDRETWRQPASRGLVRDRAPGNARPRLPRAAAARRAVSRRRWSTGAPRHGPGSGTSRWASSSSAAS